MGQYYGYEQIFKTYIGNKFLNVAYSIDICIAKIKTLYLYD